MALLVVGYALLYDDLRYSVFKISTDSMMPTIGKGEYVEVDKYFPFEKIATGDIIMVRPPGLSEKLVVHRVVSVLDEEPFTLKLKGDANESSIPDHDFSITEYEYVGKVLRIYPELESVEIGENVRYS